MQFVDLRDRRLCDNCRTWATKRLEGKTGLLRVYLCGYCVNRLRNALDELSRGDPHYERRDVEPPVETRVPDFAWARLDDTCSQLG